MAAAWASRRSGHPTAGFQPWIARVPPVSDAAVAVLVLAARTARAGGVAPRSGPRCPRLRGALAASLAHIRPGSGHRGGTAALPPQRAALTTSWSPRQRIRLGQHRLRLEVKFLGIG